MEIITCKEYNRRQQRKYDKAVEEWKDENDPNQIIPQIAFYFFWDEEANLKKDGYVAVSDDDKYHTWGKTKKKAEEKMADVRLRAKNYA